MKPLFFILERLLLVALFIGGVVVVITFVLQLDGGSAQLTSIPMTEVIAEAPLVAAASVAEPIAAVTTSAAAVAAARDVVTVCRSVPGTAPLTVCLRSNSSGTMTVDNGGQLSEYVYAFYPDGESCPTAPQGFVTGNRHMTTHDLIDFGFTQADIDALGLPGRYCAFAAAAT